MLLQLALPSCFAISDCPDLEGPNYGQIQAALAFAQEIEDFDDLINPHHLFICFLGPEPSENILEKICREEKSESSCICDFLSFSFSLTYTLFFFFFFWLVEMAMRYSKEKYAHIRG